MSSCIGVSGTRRISVRDAKHLKRLVEEYAVDEDHFDIPDIPHPNGHSRNGHRK